jgi:hypothetical protein
MIVTHVIAIRRGRLVALAVVTALVLCGAMAQRASAFEVGLQDDSVFLTQRFAYDPDKAYQQAAELGVTFLRTNVYWSDFVRYGYGPWDRLVTEARKWGIAVQMSLCGTTAFDKTGDGRLSYRNPSARRFGDFAKRFARHFKGTVKRYSIWNEPNYTYFLSPGAKSVPMYRALYLAGYKSIKSVDSRNKVLIGELGPNHDPLGFLARVSTGLRADGLAFHPFQWGAAPGARVIENKHVGISNTPRIKTTLRQLQRLRRLRTPGGGTVPIYFTEFAYPSTVIASNGKRADWTVKAYKWAKQQGVKQLVYYTLVQPPRSSGIVFNSGMINTDGTPTLVFTALRRYLTGR